jgi:thiamine-phosphate pyrophosphorylase
MPIEFRDPPIPLTGPTIRIGEMRRIALTPAAERALALAGHWTSRGNDAPIDLPELTLALLAEPECRAAEILSHLGIDAQTLQARWPNLAVRDGNRELTAGDDSPAMRNLLQVVRERLADSAEREIATEHLLWGMSQGRHEMAGWLVERGLDPDALAAEFAAEAGVPIEVELEERSQEPVVRSQEGEATRLRPVAAADHLTAVFRALDASGNRAREGLRVVEDYVRFALDDRHLTERVKAVRHELSAALETLPGAARLAARDTVGDVGTTVSTANEGIRADAGSVATASLKRTGEALRSLEEFGKIVSGKFAARCEALRYRLYTLEKAIGLTADSMARLAGARLYVLIDGRDSPESFARLVTELVDAKVDVLQLRDKSLADRELLSRAVQLRELTHWTGTLFVMNDRPDLARLSGADGVHVGQEELTVRQVRQIVGPEMLVGVSTHSLAQAEQAVLDGASYLGVGPTFPSSTKAFDEFPGLDFVRDVAENIRLPAFAIGGITLENVGQVINAGMNRVAVSAAVAHAANPSAASRAFRERLHSR